MATVTVYTSVKLEQELTLAQQTAAADATTKANAALVSAKEYADNVAASAEQAAKDYAETVGGFDFVQLVGALTAGTGVTIINNGDGTLTLSTTALTQEDLDAHAVATVTHGAVPGTERVAKMVSPAGTAERIFSLEEGSPPPAGPAGDLWAVAPPGTY